MKLSIKVLAFLIVSAFLFAGQSFAVAKEAVPTKAVPAPMPAAQELYKAKVPEIKGPGTYELITKWGSYGFGSGQFYGLRGIAVDSVGYVYATGAEAVIQPTPPLNILSVDYYTRIQRFTSDGIFKGTWGSYGEGDGHFSSPAGVAVDSDGNIYVADRVHNRIQKFTSNAAFLTKWGSEGSGDGQFDKPWGIAVDSDGYVYVADTNNHRIQKFDSNGAFLTKWGSEGSGDGQFHHPHGVAVDSAGNVYVADTGNKHIQKFDSNGAFLTRWGSYDVFDIAVDSAGNIYVADTNNHRIQKFDSNGALLTRWGSYGEGDGQFNNPIGVAVDSDGYVYVADAGNHRIQKFKKKPLIITAVPSTTHYCLVKVCSGGLDEYKSFYYADNVDDILMHWISPECTPIYNATVQISWEGELKDLSTNSNGLTPLFEQLPKSEIKISKPGYKSVVFNLPSTYKKYIGIRAYLKEMKKIELPIVPITTTTTTTIPMLREFVPVTTTTTTTLGIRRFR